MNYIQTEIDGVWLIEPKVFRDERGYFMEAFKEEDFKAHIGDVHFVQDNESKSSFGVLRGLHYQKGEYCQSKLVRVIKGKEPTPVLHSPWFCTRFSGIKRRSYFYV